LAQLLKDLSRSRSWKLQVAHCDHRWRADSEANAIHVAGETIIPSEVTDVHVADETVIPSEAYGIPVAGEAIIPAEAYGFHVAG
jgi:hypothetical protein